MSTSGTWSKPPTAVIFLSMGEPSDLDDTGRFLRTLLSDKEIMHMPMHKPLSKLIARTWESRTRAQYEEMGGPQLQIWLNRQAEGLVKELDAVSPETAPHKCYLLFRYVEPTSETVLARMRADGVVRAIAFPQYPQYCCATSGSSLNNLWRAIDRCGYKDEFEWSVIDRWYDHPLFLDCMTDTVREGLARFEPEDRDKVVLLFSAHSLPMNIINRGDPYPAEVGATVHEVMRRLQVRNPFQVSFQSKMGPLPWLGPSTENSIRQFGAKNIKHLLVVPVAFTSDHLETLHELDIELAEIAHKVGIEHYNRAPALNDRPEFIHALGAIVTEHLQRGEACRSKYPLRCPGCKSDVCRSHAEKQAVAAETTREAAGD